MEFELKPTTKVGALLDRYPFLIEKLADHAPEFARLRAPLARKTFGRLASLADAARLGGVDLDALLAMIAGEIAAQTGEHVRADSSAPGAAPTEVASAGAPPPAALGDPGPASGFDPGDRAYRVEELKEIIRELHAGRSPEEMAARFGAVLQSVSAAEIAETEQQLVAEGMPIVEVQRLCDVHAAVFRRAPGQEVAVELPAGHPLMALREANEQFAGYVKYLQGLVAEIGDPPSTEDFEAKRGQLELGLTALAAIDGHYLKKEYRLFPVLERQGAEAPPKVMWAVHDDIRAKLRRTEGAARDGDAAAVAEHLPELLEMVSEMIFKEEQILFPLCLEIFDAADWEGLDLAASADPAEAPAAYQAAHGASAAAPGAGIAIPTGSLTPEQLAMVFAVLPFDLTYVDENDEVRYYSEGQRVFPRTPEIIGRNVQNCHPPKSVHVVEQIVSAFRAGERDTADFWIEYRGRFVYIRYIALRDRAGEYRGVLEITQDATEVRALEGQRRLLDWA